MVLLKPLSIHGSPGDLVKMQTWIQEVGGEA